MTGAEGLPPVLLGFLATVFTWAVTALGAALVFFSARPSRKLFDAMLGFAAGVMIAASFFSLLIPALAVPDRFGLPSWLPAAVGFLAGGGFLRLMDRFVPHLHIFGTPAEAEGVRSSLSLSTLLFFAVTLHNIPEGLAVGVAFGSLASPGSGATFAGAAALALGIALQNFPEGFVISMPLRSGGMSRWKSFNLGQASALVEPVFGLLGAWAVGLFSPLLPYALSFAAGAMIYVVVEEVIPESHRAGNEDVATMGTLLGLSVMMVLDVAFG